METEDGGCDAFTGLEVKEFHNEIWGVGNWWFILSPHCVDYKARTGTVSCHGKETGPCRVCSFETDSG